MRRSNGGIAHGEKRIFFDELYGSWGLIQIYRSNYSCGVSGEPRLAGSLFVVEHSGPGQVADGLAACLSMVGCRRWRGRSNWNNTGKTPRRRQDLTGGRQDWTSYCSDVGVCSTEH